jgi:hypothetical protein
MIKISRYFQIIVMRIPIKFYHQSLDLGGEKENKENPEFDAQRKDAIAEAARAGSKKVFGGGTKQVCTYEIDVILVSFLNYFCRCLTTMCNNL